MIRRLDRQMWLCCQKEKCSGGGKKGGWRYISLRAGMRIVLKLISLRIEIGSAQKDLQ